MGDQGYDRDKIRKMLVQQGIPPCILPLSRQKDWRRLAIRYDGCSHVFHSTILLAAIVLFW